jgi:hypothetical protein
MRSLLGELTAFQKGCGAMETCMQRYGRRVSHAPRYMHVPA